MEKKKDIVMNAPRATELSFPMALFAEETHNDVLEPLKTGK